MRSAPLRVRSLTAENLPSPNFIIASPNTRWVPMPSIPRDRHRRNDEFTCPFANGWYRAIVTADITYDDQVVTRVGRQLPDREAPVLRAQPGLAEIHAASSSLTRLCLATCRLDRWHLPARGLPPLSPLQCTGPCLRAPEDTGNPSMDRRKYPLARIPLAPPGARGFGSREQMCLSGRADVVDGDPRCSLSYHKAVRRDVDHC